MAGVWFEALRRWCIEFSSSIQGSSDQAARTKIPRAKRAMSMPPWSRWDPRCFPCVDGYKSAENALPFVRSASNGMLGSRSARDLRIRIHNNKVLVNSIS
jgi:hypothetical protein